MNHNDWLTHSDFKLITRIFGSIRIRTKILGQCVTKNQCIKGSDKDRSRDHRRQMHCLQCLDADADEILEADSAEKSVTDQSVTTTTTVCKTIGRNSHTFIAEKGRSFVMIHMPNSRWSRISALKS